jgi:hypothetical protein
VIVEKHVYHKYQAEEPEPVVEVNEGFRFAFSVVDEKGGSLCGIFFNPTFPSRYEEPCLLLR